MTDTIGRRKVEQSASFLVKDELLRNNCQWTGLVSCSATQNRV